MSVKSGKKRYVSMYDNGIYIYVGMKMRRRVASVCPLRVAGVPAVFGREARCSFSCGRHASYRDTA